jgi:hypothetical protein
LAHRRLEPCWMDWVMGVMAGKDWPRRRTNEVNREGCCRLQAGNQTAVNPEYRLWVLEEHLLQWGGC